MEIEADQRVHTFTFEEPTDDDAKERAAVEARRWSAEHVVQVVPFGSHEPLVSLRGAM